MVPGEAEIRSGRKDGRSQLMHIMNWLFLI